MHYSVQGFCLLAGAHIDPLFQGNINVGMSHK
jgi:hypothetical protein